MLEVGSTAAYQPCETIRAVEEAQCLDAGGATESGVGDGA